MLRVSSTAYYCILTLLLTQNQALLSVFKGRSHELRDKESAIERCEVQLRDSPDETKCRLVVQMICRHGEDIV